MASMLQLFLFQASFVIYEGAESILLFELDDGLCYQKNHGFVCTKRGSNAA